MDCDFDEYDYLEKSVDDAKVRRDKALPRSHHRRDRRREDGAAAAAAGTPDRNGAKTASSKRHRSERDKDRQGGEREHREREPRERDTRMEREKVRERPPFRGREFEREMGERENRRVKEKKEEVEPEADPERDQRTVFAYQMPLKATEKDIYEFFSKAGKVRDVRLILDRSTRRSKGVGYIEFYDAMSVPMAIAMSGHQLFGHPVMVKPSEAEKNLVRSNATSGSGVVGTAVARKIYVGNLHFNITEDQLRKVFEPFGQVEIVQLPLDLETGQCKGYGFVQFTQVEHAKAALTLNGNLDIAGRIIKVSAVTDHFGLQDSVANAGSFDDDDGGGLSLNARSRALLMQKLDRTGTASSIVEALGIPTLNGTLPISRQAVVPLGFPGALASLITEPIGDPSEYVLLKNMFDPNTEMDPDFDLNIKEEVEEECSKFGPVKHIYVDKKSDGHVYLQFDGVVAATTCQRAMHKRWFARRSISATYMLPHEFAAKCSSDQ